MSEEVDRAFNFLGGGPTDSPLVRKARSSNKGMPFTTFAANFFQDKSEGAAKYSRSALLGPLLKQIWGDGDSERVTTCWLSILRFLGDLPCKSGVSNLQLVQHVCNTGITRPNTRDELYCQICKQLTENPNRASTARAWILLALCCGSFPPSDNFLGVLETQIENGPPLYKPFVQERLARTLKMGVRKLPPTALEIASAFSKNPIELPVFFFSGSIVFQGDSQTTAAEVTAALFDDPRLTKDYGYSLYMCSRNMEQMTSIGAGQSNIMEVAYLYESLLEQKGTDWTAIRDNLPWCLIFRKETFAPWIERYVNMDAIYLQIMDGLERGALSCDDAGRMALILAQRYHILAGPDFDRDKLLHQLKMTPLSGMEKKSNEQWMEAVTAVYTQEEYQTKNTSPGEMKVELITFAKTNWTRHFSKRFMNCNVVTEDGQHDNVTVLVNGYGLIIVEESKGFGGGQNRDVDIAALPFTQFADVGSVQKDRATSKSFFEVTCVQYGKSKYAFFCDEASDLHSLVDHYFRGCCFRSKYVMAMCSYRAPADNSAFLSFEQGDVIILPKIWAEADSGGWCNGVCERTKKQGDFPSANVFVLPALSRPDANVIALFAKYCTIQGGDEI
eukprot:m.26649 g.26649  ORF g.26649 m.26649 type:complete len:615 (+) comp11548_c0_seq1:81-1925(+)